MGHKRHTKPAAFKSLRITDHQNTQPVMLRPTPAVRSVLERIEARLGTEKARDVTSIVGDLVGWRILELKGRSLE